MCGIAGLLNLEGAALRADRCKPMLDAISHRGPDDAGYLFWHTGRMGGCRDSFGQSFADPQFSSSSLDLPVIDSIAGREKLHGNSWDFFFGHRRLAVLDLSHRGHQPMSDRAGRVWISYNGEVYNFRDLRSELAGLGYSFDSTSDTEVILHAYRAWGEEAIARFNGMFALAIWDPDRDVLLIARDRYGIKPLYYSLNDGTFSFASEIKPLLRASGARRSIDALALNEYLSFQNVLSDRTLFDAVKTVPPGHSMTIRVSDGEIKMSQYWDFHFGGSIAAEKVDIEARLVELLTQAVERQCVSDVPVGSYLSGGMDSCTIATIASRGLGRISTFTAGFDLSEAVDSEASLDEREQAERMSSALQTRHYEVVLHSGDMESVLDSVVSSLEDLRIGQCYPNKLIAHLASRFVKVVMSGGGGDELFAGYPWRYAAAIGKDGSAFADNYYRYWKRLVSDEDKQRVFAPCMRDLLESKLDGVEISQHTFEAFRSVFRDPIDRLDVESQINQSLYFECKTFLHGLLIVEDRLSMAFGLETRLPFLDNDLVDYACQIPPHLKLSNLEALRPLDENLPRKKKYYEAKGEVSGKTILRSAMERILPPEITGARKQGFTAPDESWFRGRSGRFVRERLLDRGPLHSVIDRNFIEATLAQHLDGRANKRLLIWSFLSIESWMRQFEVGVS